ncbi:MAG: 16S rRNA (adenine(1518)-N(6)/adenine(1519)-N(6))-dimethyltransferase RsmA [Betaproteobacteria bacterium]
MIHHRPRKRFSQNFLVDRHFIDRIVGALAPRRTDALVEIGPGRGALTRPLLECVDHLTVIEIDRDLACALQTAFPPGRLTVRIEDALEVDLGQLGSRLRVVGNLPYHISSPLLFHCGQYAGHIQDMHFMLQAEVVERMAALPATPEYGRLSVMLQAQFQVEKLFGVPAVAFNPVPAVESAVVRLTPLGAARPDIRNVALFEAVVAAGFGQRRKTLRNALQNYLDPDALHALGVDSGLRAETLPVATFVAIANFVAATREPVSRS